MSPKIMEHTNNVNKILDIIFSVKPDILEEVNISILKIMEKTMRINTKMKKRIK
jgi:hypothetical protein